MRLKSRGFSSHTVGVKHKEHCYRVKGSIYGIKRLYRLLPIIPNMMVCFSSAASITWQAIYYNCRSDVLQKDVISANPPVLQFGHSKLLWRGMGHSSIMQRNILGAPDSGPLTASQTAYQGTAYTIPRWTLKNNQPSQEEFSAASGKTGCQGTARKSERSASRSDRNALRSLRFKPLASAMQTTSIMIWSRVYSG